MSRNRFQLWLRFVHFADNQSANADDQLFKVRKLLEILERNFTKRRDLVKLLPMAKQLCREGLA